jgi:glycosyltransferase involved in cell wall biosynthesis
MKPPLTYQINHIQLASNEELPTDWDRQRGWYLVFWCKEIPVGHLFVEPDDNLTREEVIHKSRAVIEAYIDAIQPKTADENAQRQTVSTETSMADLTHELIRLVSRFDVQPMPASVPVSAVICTRNRPDQLKRCLQSLQALPCQPEEVLVVDNAPSDSSTQHVVSEFPGVVYCREPRPGLDVARNAGVRRASLPVVAYLDDDVTIHPHWVYHVWQTFEDPAVAAMTGLVIALELNTEAQVIFETFWSFNRGYLDKYYDQAYFDRTLASGPPVWEVGAGANMAFRRSLFAEVGYFDERLDAGAAGCNGDSEMWFRVLAHGHTIHYNPRAILFHEHRQELTALKKQIYSYMRGHTVAALIQQRQVRKAGYWRYLLRILPRSYFHHVKAGFPKFESRHLTVGVEMKGILSGLRFYMKNREEPPY